MYNEKQLEENVTADLNKLEEIIQKYSTTSIFERNYSYNLVRENSDQNNILHSPAKQLSFLIGVAMSTPEPKRASELDGKNWKNILDLLDRLFNHYLLLYFPSSTEDNKEQEWWHKRKVASIAFFNYFDSGLLASVEQVKERITSYIIPFDAIIEEKLHLSVKKCIEISDYISKQMQEASDQKMNLKTKEKSLRNALIEKHMGDNWTIDIMRKEAQAGPYLDIFKELIKNINNIGFINLKDIKNKFKKDGEKYCEIFTINRGKGPKLKYPTEQSIIYTKPLVICGNERAICSVSNSLFLAVYFLSEKIILKSKVKDTYLKNRDHELEKETLKVLKDIINKDAIVLTSVYESENSQYEHDIIIDDKRLTLVVEAKASPPKEPFRNPEKAFVRIQDAFKSDTGIQKAYEQSNKVLNRLKKEKDLNLYNQQGEFLYNLKYNPRKLQIGICVTRDNFGALATDLSLLLSKEECDLYPWAVNIFDLQNFVDAWKYLNKSELDFVNFLKGRIKLHGLVNANDELEYAGYYLQHGSFSALFKCNASKILLDSNYAKIFNKIYYAQYHHGEKVDIKVVNKAIGMDLRKSLQQGEPVFFENEKKSYNRKKKVGRNEKCPCGSGKKYKYCCGR